MTHYSKEKAIENLRNTTEYLQFVLFSLCLASSEESVPITSVEKIHLKLGSCIVDLSDFGREFIKDRKHQKRFDSTVIKLLSSGVSMAYNVAEKYYETLDKKHWKKIKEWQTPYPYAYQIRNMFSHAFFWDFREGWKKEYKKSEEYKNKNNKNGDFSISYGKLKIEEAWNGRKAIIEDVSPCGDLIQLVEDIITDISKS